nr:precorrin-2 C(20)-methyltransferase [uncultured Cohaesibacter sp.]
MINNPKGTLYGVGVGPGDPELITLKAARLIREAVVVAYPAPEGGDSFARDIAKAHITSGTREISIAIPMRPERKAAQDAYDVGAVDVRAELEAGNDVVFLCEGDPFFYGTFMYLYDRLAADFSTEIIPGVTSIVACACRLKQPLVSRNDVLTVLAGPMSDEELEARLALGGSFAIMKVGRHLPRIRALVEKLGLMGRAGYVERATLENEKAVPLADLKEASAPYFSMILIYDGDEAWKN